MIEPAFGPGPLVGPSDGRRAARLARALFGVDPLDWQRFVLDHALERDTDAGRYRYRTVLVTMGRQNGKTTAIGALIGDRLAFGPRTTTGAMSANRQQAKVRLFEPLVEAFESKAPFFEPKAIRSNAYERLLLRAVSSALYMLTADEKSAHGYSLDLAVIDEAWALTDYRVPQAIVPTQIALPGAQLVVLSTAGTDESVWLRELVEIGRKGSDPRMLFVEWSAGDDREPGDPAGWREANPSLGQTITEDSIAAARLAMADDDQFERACLNRWTATVAGVIPLRHWRNCAEPSVRVADRGMAFAFDVHRDRAHATIAAASPVGPRVAVEIVEQRSGTAWVLPRLAELVDRYGAIAVVARNAGAARSLLDEAPFEGLRVDRAPAGDYQAGCQTFYDLTLEGRLAHRGQDVLDAAVAAAGRRPVGDSWVFGPPAHRDISPLVAATLAAWRASRPHLVPKLVVG
jgi:hypothetical protein